MNRQPETAIFDPNSVPELPAWIPSGHAETVEAVTFRSGAALVVLDALAHEPRHFAPVQLLANHLALKAATATSRLEGRLAREADIRDAYHLTPPGGARGPDGDLLAFWRQAVRLRLTGRDWRAGLSDLVGPGLAGDVAGWMDAGAERANSNGPLAGGILGMRMLLKVDHRAERLACLLSDVIVARALNWRSVLPITAQRLTKPVLRDLAADGRGSELNGQQRLLGSVEDAIRCAHDLAKRVAGLRTVAPKLRAKGADAAVALFLSEDAVSPSSMLSPMIQGTTIAMTDRAARRFCDRLVDLGVAHELTGRSTFRLYGVAP